MGTTWHGRIAAVLLAASVVACGGGGDEQAVPPESSEPAIGAAGGTVTSANGAVVVVPPGALSTGTTIRVAMDSTGAPALPAALGAAGNTYVVTPHGGEFAEPVEVRIPASNAGLRPNEELKLAKAQPGGEWELLTDSVLADGVLSARVSSFSYFVAVRVSYLLPIAQLEPLRVTSSLDCGDRICDPTLGTVTATYVVTTNGGQLPAGCSTNQLIIQSGGSSPNFSAGALGSTSVPLRGGSVTRTLAPRTPYYFTVGARCSGTSMSLNYGYTAARRVLWLREPYYPALAVMRAPAQLDVVPGLAASLDVILAGGASGLQGDPAMHPAPTAANRAVIDWQRSDDNGGSWRAVARSYQDEANPNPVGEGLAWKYWSVRHGFIAASADQGALLRVHACYTPPDVPAPACVVGPSTRLNVLQQSALPALVTAPRSVLVRSGQTASLSAAAGGLPAPTLQWQTRGANANGAWINVSGGTGGATGNYTTAVLSTADNGTQYRVVASNALGSAESAPVTVSVSDLDVAPSVTTQPAPLNVTAGNDAAFAIVARGTEALSYQWSKDGTAIVGANSPVLRLAGVTAGQAGAYSVRVSNAAGTATSDAALLTVSAGVATLVAPTIVTPPVSVQVNAGNTATFAVGVAGSGPLAFQWQKNGVDIAGATAAFHSIASAQAADAGSYAVRVNNAAGTVTSAAATLSVAPAGAAVAPSITTQPSPQAQVPGGSVTFAVAASGSGPLAYQWSKGGTAIAGSTAAVLTLPALTATDAGSYSVVVSNAQGSAASDAATLTVIGAPAIGSPPAIASALEGGTATFTVAASGSGLRYQWTRNGLPVGSATAASHTTPPLTLGDSGAVYAVVVYNGAGAIFSQGAVLTVTPAAQAARAWGTAVAIETDNAGNAESVQVAANASGQVVAVWQQSDGATINIYANRYSAAAGWGTPQRINPGVVAETAQQPHVAIDDNGNAIAVWMQSNFAANSTADDIWASRYTAQSGWGAPVLIENDPLGAGQPRVAMDGAGNAIAVFSQQAGGRLVIHASRFEPATGWAPPTAIETDASAEGVAPQIAMEANGRATVVWQAFIVPVETVTEYQVRSNRYTAAAGWGSAARVATTANNATPHVAIDGAGHAVAVWVAPDGTWDSIWSSRTTAGGGWTPPVLIETDNTNSARTPHVAIDGSGNAIAVWAQSDGLRDNIMANRYVAGAGWGGAVLIETDNAGSAYEPQVVIDGSGNATAVWSQRNVAGFTFNAWANRYSPATGWGTPTVIDNSPEPARSTQIAIDGLGNVTAAWAQNSGARTDLWANTLR